MNEIGLLTAVIPPTKQIVAAATHAELGLPTPCPARNMQALPTHIAAYRAAADPALTPSLPAAAITSGSGR